MQDIPKYLNIQPRFTTELDLKFGDYILITEQNIELMKPYLSDYKWRSRHRLTDKKFYKPNIIIVLSDECYYYHLDDPEVATFSNIKYYIPIDL